MRTNYLQTKLSEYFVDKANETRVREKLSVSDTGCLLHRELKLWGIKPDREPTLEELITFDYGNHLHAYLQKRLEGTDEFELEDKYFIGHVDKLTKEDGFTVVNEFKSIKDYALDMIIKEDKPQEAHLKQAMNYARMMKAVDKTTANFVRIIYIAKCFDDAHRKMLYKNKDVELAEGKTTIRIVEFTEPYDEELANKIVEEAEFVLESVDKGMVIACSEWDKVYHRDTRWNNYLSWCSQPVEVNQERITNENKHN